MRSCAIHNADGFDALDARTIGGPPAPATVGSPDTTFALPGDAPTYAPDRPADVRHLDIAITLDFETQTIHGDVTTWFSALFEEVRAITLDAAELSITQVTLAEGDRPLVFWTEGETLRVQLDRTYHYGESFGVRVRYHAQPRTGLRFVAPTRGNPELPHQVWTQGETEFHHFWLPCHDFPNDRATTALSATVPVNMIAISNGKLEETRENGDGTKTYRWRQEVPFPAYLITLVAGEYSQLTATAQSGDREIPLTYNVPPGREDDGWAMMGHTPQMIAYYTEHFGLEYPYVKYAQTIAETFLGAMENVSATTHTFRLLADARARLDYTPEPVVAHELVHQWFGDLLAVRDWAHTWLKESFATYFEATWMEHEYGVDEFREEMRGNLNAYLDGDAHGRRPIVYNVYRKNGEELFDVHDYQKGSLVLNMLRNILGEAPFWRGLQRYAQRNQGREVITADFERALEEATGRSLAQFFEQWVYKAGHPEFNVSYAWDDERRMAKLTVRQTQQVTELTPLFVTPVDLAFFVPADDHASPDDASAHVTPTVFRVTVDQVEQTFYIPLPRRPFGVRFDYGGWLIKTLTFDRSPELLRYQLWHDPDVRGRIEAAEALGKLADAQSVTTLEAALLAEPFWGVRAAIARALGAQHTERALDALITALDRLDPQTEPKARRAIVAALGEFQAHEGTTQTALAECAAATLTALLERGDPSYYVFAAAARALGATRAPGAFERLTTLVDIPSWIEIIRGGVFGGIGATGDPRAVDILASWATDLSKPMDARAAAARGLAALAQTKRIEPGAAQTRAVDALIVALDDPWETTAAAAVGALAAWGDRRAIPALQRLVSTGLDERLIRGARVTLRRLQTGDTAAEGVSQLRDDVETLRDENRKLRARLDVLEAATKYTPEATGVGANGHAANGNGANGHATNDREAAGSATANGAPTTKRRAKKVSADKSVD